MYQAVQGRAWVEKLLAMEYDELDTVERVDALVDLMHLALELPSIHSLLDRHYDEVHLQHPRLSPELCKCSLKLRPDLTALLMLHVEPLFQQDACIAQLRGRPRDEHGGESPLQCVGAGL